MTEVAIPRSAPPDRVPTLTEVLSPGPARGNLGAASANHAAAGTAGGAGSAGAESLNQHDEDMLQRVQAKVLIDMEQVLSQRLRSALEPVMQQAFDQLLVQMVAAARAELASTLREQVGLAMAQENSGHRSDPEPR